MREEEPELISKTYDELCNEQNNEEPKVYFSSCCGAKANGSDLDYMICPDCHDHCAFEDEEGVEHES